MSKIILTNRHLQLELEVTPTADFIGCLLTGVMAALPAFLEAFMKCLAGGEGTTGYKPGDRDRCA